MSTFFEKYYEKIQRTNDEITDCSQSGFITIDMMIMNLKLTQLRTILNSMILYLCNSDLSNKILFKPIMNNSWIKFDTVSLDVNSKVQIEGGEMLDDRTIEACQTKLNSQFPGINGFQATVIGQGDISFMPIAKDMLQILFKGDNKCGHWFTISILNLKPGYVNIYDSLN